jgi:hypothetical protein
MAWINGYTWGNGSAAFTRLRISDKNLTYENAHRVNYTVYKKQIFAKTPVGLIKVSDGGADFSGFMHKVRTNNISKLEQFFDRRARQALEEPNEYLNPQCVAEGFIWLAAIHAQGA